jgi:hypothetical protein
MDLCSRAHRVVTLLFAPQVTPLHWLHIFKDSFQPRTAAQSSACSKISASVWVTESLLSVASHTSSRNVVCCRPIQTYTTLSRRCQGVLNGRTEALWQQCLRVHDRWCAMKAVQAGDMMRYDPKLVGRDIRYLLKYLPFRFVSEFDLLELELTLFLSRLLFCCLKS